MHFVARRILEENTLSGTVPIYRGPLVELYTFFIFLNHAIYFFVLCSDLDDNALTGTIPAAFGRYINMTELYAESVFFGVWVNLPIFGEIYPLFVGKFP